MSLITHWNVIQYNILLHVWSNLLAVTIVVERSLYVCSTTNK